MIDAARLINRLENFGLSLPELVANLPPEDACWKPDDGAWSVLEVVRHLLDEETDDFRLRLRSTVDLHPWPAIDPEGWAIDRKYNEGSLPDAAARFAEERKISVAWLRGLNDSVWPVAYQHPRFGPIRAGDLLAAWAAHDAMHLRQIAKRLYQLAQRDGGEYLTIYAGEWHA